jgi:hypothetical protein
VRWPRAIVWKREDVIYCRAAGGAEQRNVLSDELLRDDNLKIGATLRDQAGKRCAI